MLMSTAHGSPDDVRRLFRPHEGRRVSVPLRDAFRRPSLALSGPSSVLCVELMSAA
jgi:hypothetical protein